MMTSDERKSMEQAGEPSFLRVSEIVSLFDRYLDMTAKVGCHAMSPEEGQESVRGLLREMRLKGYGPN